MSSGYVLAASAVLALLNDEPGSKKVETLLDNSIIGAVNQSEVLAKLIDAGLSRDEARETFDLLNLEVVNFDTTLAEETAALLPQTKKKGLSLGDLSCIALAKQTGRDVVTADPDWLALKLCPTILVR